MRPRLERSGKHREERRNDYVPRAGIVFVPDARESADNILFRRIAIDDSVAHYITLSVEVARTSQAESKSSVGCE